MPLLFAATLFVSASLLFMVQPMVGKMVLPLLGGSPAVWNACMVFFQALLLLGYLYAHKLASIESPRRQWTIHMIVLAAPLTVFAVAALLSTRHSPIAIVEALAPTDEKSPILSVLAILTVAIGIPFFVVSTTATLLQKWFVYTGHPSARDPYFLYAASNVGSLISLLGYPLVIEPRMPIVGQAWVFAVGFVGLVAMIFLCGRAANNPIGVPPPPSKPNGKAAQSATSPAGNVSPSHPHSPAPDAPPALARKLKWIALAFVPSTLMLGVTFHMTTDIASIPLLWVGPLALYLVTFIIAFGTIRAFLASTLLLPAVFCLVVGLVSGSPMLPVAGVVFGGLFFVAMYFANSLGVASLSVGDSSTFRVVIGNLAPVMILLLIFVMISGVKPGVGIELLLHNVTFFAAALMCHYELARDRPSPKYLTEFFLLMSVGGMLGGVFNSLVAPMVFPQAYEYPIALIVACLMVPKLLDDEDAPVPSKRRKQINLALDFLIPFVLGVGFYFLVRMTGDEWFIKAVLGVSAKVGLSFETIRVIFIFAVPVMLCFFFVDRPLRFALCVAALIGPYEYRKESEDLVHSERSFFGILKVQEDDSYQFLRDGEGKALRYPEGAKNSEGKDVGDTPIVAGQYHFRKLVHGTTLHGTQVAEHKRHFLDDFQMLNIGVNPWDSLAVAGATHAWDVRAEPLTYYHRTGPVGAMVSELRKRKGGADAKAPFAMVGLGTGSASCYVQPGQQLTFYEIDPAVKHLVGDTDKWFTYVQDGMKRAKSAPGGFLEIHMGDARLKLKDDADRKYALLLVDAFSSDSIPVHLLTVEALQLYLERMTDDGILALHISNKFVKLEPVVAAIANHLGLVARVWNDDAERKPGKTASSWVTLARKAEHLGGLYSKTGDLIFDVGPDSKGNDKQQVSMENQIWQNLVYNDYPKELQENVPGTRKEKYQELNETTPTKDNPRDARDAWLEWIKAKQEKETRPEYKERLRQHEDLITRFGPAATFQEVMMRDHGHAFRRLDTLVDVPAWTDDYSDVMRVMMIPELQKVRKFFGLPTPIER